MAFPTTSVLDSFTRVDENPLANSTWLGPIQNTKGQLKLISNQILGNGGTCQDYWTSTTGADCEVFIDIPTLPAGGNAVAVYGRIANPNNASTATAYLLVYIVGTGFQYYKFTAGNVFTQIGSTDSGTLSAGDSLGLSITGSATTTLSGFKKTGGTWSALATVPTVTDSSSPITAGGFIGVEVNDVTSRLDNFGGGTVVVGGTSHSYNSLLLGVG